LGMELRMHSLKAAPVDTANAEFMRPGVTAELEDLSEESVHAAVRKVIKHFNWNGPVGVSVTRAIMRTLGNQQAAKRLERMMPETKGKVATMIHTEAAGYAEMYFGPGLKEHGVVVVATIGKGMGTVTYNNGQKVRNSDLKHLTWTYERELGKLRERWGWDGYAPDIPPEKDEAVLHERYALAGPARPLYRRDGDLTRDFEEEEVAAFRPILAYATLVDKYLQKIAGAVKPDKIILLTTGAASQLPEDALFALLQPGIASKGLSGDTIVMGEFPTMALVKGAAIGAHVELGRRQAGEVLRAAVTNTIVGDPKPRELFEEDLLWIFRKLDRDKDGVISHDDLLQGVKVLGTSFSDAEVKGLLRDFTGGMKEVATAEQFTAWFARALKLAVAHVHEVHSEDEFNRFVKEWQEKTVNVETTGGTMTDEDGSLVVLECGYTHCRPCMKFEKTYEGVAKKYQDAVRLLPIRPRSRCERRSLRTFPVVTLHPRFPFNFSQLFLKVLGDACPGAAHLCRDVLEIQGTPEFRFYRGKKLLHVMRGADRGKLERTVQEYLGLNPPVEEPAAVPASR